MIENIKFGHNKKSNFVKNSTFYVYHSLSRTAFINSDQKDWFGVELDIVATLCHETLHKVLFKLEGGKTSTALDKWCKSRDWLYNDNTGFCLFAWETPFN
jgi:hypothetical protein